MARQTIAKTSHVLNIVIPYARGLFRRYGYKKTTIDEIAGGVHISKRTLYAVFPSKDVLLRETLWHDIVGAIRVFNTTVLPGTESDRMLLALCKFIFIDRIKRGKDGYFWGLYADDNDIHNATMEAIKRVVKTLYEDGVRKGCFKPIDPMLGTEVVVNIVGTVVALFSASKNPLKMFNESLGIIADAVAYRDRIRFDAMV